MRKKRSFLTSIIGAYLFNIFVVFFDPFNLETSISQAVNTFFQRALAPRIANFDTESVVVVIDDAFLDERELSWPLSYGQYASIIRIISSFNPKAIFIDIAFLDERNDESLPLLLDAISKVSGTVPVFLVGISPETGRANLSHSFSSLANDGANISLVYPIEKIEHGSNAYKLREDSLSAAQKMYEVYCFVQNLRGCEEKLMKQRGEMEVLWSPSHRFNCERSDDPGCMHRDSSSIERTAGLLLHGALGRFAERHYPGWGELSGGQRLSLPLLKVSEMYRSFGDLELFENVSNSYIFLGSGVSYATYMSWSPQSGYVVSAATHAMAFENLKAMGGGYKKTRLDSSILSMLFEVAIITFAHIMMIALVLTSKEVNYQVVAKAFLFGIFFVVATSWYSWEGLRLSPYWSWNVLSIMMATFILVMGEALGLKSTGTERGSDVD